MASYSAKTVLIQVGDGASPEVFTTLEGQDSATISLETTFANANIKAIDNNISIPVKTGGTITFSGKRQGGANTAFDALVTAQQALATVSIRAIEDTDGSGYQGTYGVSLSIEGTDGDVVTYNGTLEPNSAVTTYTP